MKEEEKETKKEEKKETVDSGAQSVPTFAMFFLFVLVKATDWVFDFLMMTGKRPGGGFPPLPIGRDLVHRSRI